MARKSPLFTLGLDASGRTTAEVLSGCDLNFRTEVVPAMAALPDGSFRRIPDKFATVRSDTGAPLGSVGGRYRPFHNEEIYSFGDTVSAGGIAKWENAGHLDGGRVVWGMFRLPHVIRAGAGDETYTYGMVAAAHDGSMPVTLWHINYRLACSNALRRERRKAKSRAMTIRHTASAKNRVDDALHAFAAIGEESAIIQEETTALVNRQMTENEMRQYVAPFFPTRPAKQVEASPPVPYNPADMLEAVLSQTVSAAEAGDAAREMAVEIQEEARELSDRQYARNERILDEILGTWEREGSQFGYNAWIAYNAVSNHLDHGATFRGEGRQREENRFISVLNGVSDTVKQAAYQSALALTNV
jgi:phage/plasmid-like protein (TIGR03299 family)